MQITAFKCEKTGAIFEQQSDYDSHLRKLRKEAADKQEALEKKERLEAAVDRPRLEATSVEHLEALLKASYAKILGMTTSGQNGGRTVPAFVDFKLKVFLQKRNSDRNVFIEVQPVPSNKVLTGSAIITLSKEPDFMSRLNANEVFPWLHAGGGNRQSEKEGFTKTYDVTINLDDLPLLYVENLTFDALCQSEESLKKQVSAKVDELAAADANLGQIAEERDALQTDIRALQAKLQALDLEASATREMLVVQARTYYPELDSVEKARLSEALSVRKEYR